MLNVLRAHGVKHSWDQYDYLSIARTALRGELDAIGGNSPNKHCISNIAQKYLIFMHKKRPLFRRTYKKLLTRIG